VVQLYVHDPVASVVRPVQRLVGYTKLALEPGQTARIRVEVCAELASFTGRSGDRIVEPGELVFGFGHSSADIPITATVVVTGEPRVVGFDRVLHPEWHVG